MVIFIVLGILVVLTLYIIFLYNNIIRKKNTAEKAFGTVDVLLKKRYDLILNLVETVKQFMYYESTVFNDVTKLRSKLSVVLSSDEKVELHNNISSRLNNILVSFENYPDIKSNKNFLKLQASMNETEEQLSASRRFYNAAIADYNTAIETFPANFITSIFGFNPKKVFEIVEIERSNLNKNVIFN